MKRLLILLALPLALGLGCARYPSTPQVLQPRQRLILQMTVQGRINAAYYYFFAIDSDGNPSDGPVPLVMTPSTPMPASGVPLIISDTDVPPADYVVFHNGAFQHYRNGVFVGPPFAYTSPAPDSQVLTITLDRTTLANPSALALDINFINSERLIPPDDPLALLDYDGLGPRGDEYVSVPTTANATFDNDQAAIPEEASDTPVADLDIVDWRIEIRNE